MIFRKKYPDADENMEKWNLKQIEAFQNDLMEKVKSSVSTKWFYTHIKSSVSEKLPRIDVLDILSRY
jgi:hypothetical protein